MQELIYDEIKNELTKLQEGLDKENNATIVLGTVVKSVSGIIQETIQGANKTVSVDERIQFLVGGLQKTINYLETTEETLLKTVSEKKIKIETLKSILDKVDLLIEDKKK